MSEIRSGLERTKEQFQTPTHQDIEKTCLRNLFGTRLRTRARSLACLIHKS
jgi:hypothetical protein